MLLCFCIGHGVAADALSGIIVIKVAIFTFVIDVIVIVIVVYL